MIKIEVSVSVQTSVEKVWEFFTDPKHVVNWNFANDEWHCPRAESDFRVGGEFVYRMEAKSGEMGFDFGGVFEEIVEFQKFSYRLGDNRGVEVLFLSNNGTTTVKEIFDAEDENSAEMQRLGWQAILENFKKYVESRG